MKVMFHRADDICQVEDIGPFKRHIMMQDGDHPTSPKCVLNDAEGKLPAIVIIWQGIPGPEGDSYGTLEGEAIALEADMIKQHRQKVSISKRWVRRLWWGMVLFGKIVLVTFLSTVLIMLAWAFMGAFL